MCVSESLCWNISFTGSRIGSKILYFHDVKIKWFFKSSSFGWSPVLLWVAPKPIRSYEVLKKQRFVWITWACFMLLYLQNGIRQQLCPVYPHVMDPTRIDLNGFRSVSVGSCWKQHQTREWVRIFRNLGGRVCLFCFYAGAICIGDNLLLSSSYAGSHVLPQLLCCWQARLALNKQHFIINTTQL